jgi:hypothetical protein
MFRLPPRKSNQPQPADEGYSKCFGPDEDDTSRGIPRGQDQSGTITGLNDPVPSARG